MGAEVDQVSAQDQTSGAAEDAAPLASLFPGETVTLSTGRVLVVRPWGMRALTHEVPTLVGRVLAKIEPVRASLQAGATGDDLMPMLLAAAGEDFMGLIAWTIGFTQEEMDALDAADGMRLVRAVFRVNRGFFAEVIGLYNDFGREV